MSTTSVPTNRNGEDFGDLGTRQNWWFDPTFEHAFSIFSLESFYDPNYYATDHVFPETVTNYVSSVLEYGQRLLGREVQSIVEMGSAGGWFTKGFLEAGRDIVAIEGSRHGIERALARGVPTERVLQHDLRRPLTLNRRFDVALCTEVAEHIECPFSSQLVQNLVNHSDIIWFSFEPPGTNGAHYHHSNKQPEAFWKNLFHFYGYEMLKLPASLFSLTQGRAGYLFVSPTIAADRLALSRAKMPLGDQPSLGQRLSVAPPSDNLLKTLVKKVAPPILWDMARALRKWS